MIIFLLYTNVQFAKEVLIYADNIQYDSDKNIIAKGNAKIISENQVIISELIIYNKLKEKYILPTEFSFKDDLNNHYYGTSGEFSSDLNTAKINDIKLKLNDGSRITGQHGIRDHHIDIISKGVYTPCTSKIKIKSFICPIWQLEGEKILHDSDKLFLYQKHPKMKILNLPVYYLPYLVTPSPLRKKRKSGFLTPTISWNFIDSKIIQSTSLPYYFNINIDKELTLTPIINYGGGIDSSQSFAFDYNQIISGGSLNVNVYTNTEIENQNNETWFKNGSIETNFSQNLNEKYTLSVTSAFQTSPTFIKRTNINNLINQQVSLESSLSLDGYNLLKENDNLNFSISSYQVVRKDDDNKNTPTALPYIRYETGYDYYNNIQYNNRLSFYNIFRDSATGGLAQRQQKINYNLLTDYELYRLNSKINFKTEILTQLYNIENKPIDDKNYSGTYSRIFPMSGIYIKTPIRNNIYNFTISPQISFILNGSQPSSNKISNEESSNSGYSLINNTSLNRFIGSDKLDNSKRVNYGIDLNKDSISASISQSYEFDQNSNYNKQVGLKDHMSDVLFSLADKRDKIQITYDNRINVDIGEIANQSLSASNQNLIGNFELTYTEDKKEINSILTTGSESLTFVYTSNKFKKYNTISYDTNIDLIKNYTTEYNVSYAYFDECFGINLNFQRDLYEDRDLKPQDIFTIMFSFKNLGSYSSTNLAVSEQDKQDIRWFTGSEDLSAFEILNND